MKLERGLLVPRFNIIGDSERWEGTESLVEREYVEEVLRAMREDVGKLSDTEEAVLSLGVL
jgi:hypothetical protein